jgi:hypothetical protein
MGSHAASYRVSGGPTAPAVLPLALSELSHLAGVTSANAVNVTFCVPTTVPVHAVKSEDGIPAETGMLNEPPIANASVSLVSTYGSDTFGSGIFGDTLGGPPLVTTLEAYLDGELLFRNPGLEQSNANIVTCQQTVPTIGTFTLTGVLKGRRS